MNPSTSSKVKIIKGDLILKKDTTFKQSIEVEGNIKGYFNLKVAGNIKALDINARNIDARNIDAWDINTLNINAMNINARNIDARNIDAWDINTLNINARNIDAGDIDAWDINALDIICEKRIKKEKSVKTISRIFIQGRCKLERKEQMQ